MVEVKSVDNDAWLTAESLQMSRYCERYRIVSASLLGNVGTEEMSPSELVPDQSHLDQVRDALWSRPGNGATVMVGSGFSKCAAIAQPGADPLPLWQDLTTEMAKRLYSKSADNPLRCAQEFASSFGRTNLHGFLQGQVRDQDFAPGAMHSRLLKLPWRDVFTTNWDTLLERTMSQVVVPAYSVVVDMNQLPLASQPRIMKLHGSLPAQFPLICTEEDYRTYPVKFAPFVNTVQQAMMETAFCLIGFSGDDPNFLHWSGWVRDNLGSATPKIYLVGWLDLSVHKRRMLEERGIVPVDLAHHPNARQWPDHLRYSYAIDWILHSLERGRPYDLKAWPLRPTEQIGTPPTYLDPVIKVVSELPKQELSWNSQVGPRDQQERVKRIISAWTHNRRMYPGWLVFPDGREREFLRYSTNEWERAILNSLPLLSIVERLDAVRELVWRRELLLEPISSEIEVVAAAILGSIDCHNRTVDGAEGEGIVWSEVRETWREVALTLVTAARFRFDRHLFSQRIDALANFVNDHPDVGHRIRHERCLWALYSMDFETLNALVEEWYVEDDDPFWLIRKAAMLWELDRNREAADQVRRSLAKIRSQNQLGTDIFSASRESWALWSEVTLDNESVTRNRWAELARLKCDALMEKEHIKNVLGRSSDKEDAPDFDLGSRRTTRITFSNANVTRHLPAYRAVRLSEVAGLPRVTDHGTLIPMAVAGDILKMASDDLASHSPELAVRLVLRSCNYDEDIVLKRVLSRIRVARMPVEVADKLAEDCFKLIDHGLKQGWPDRIRVGMEVLSRLVVRMKPESVLNVFPKSMEYYANRQDTVASHPWLSKALGSLLQRSWDALPRVERIGRALDVMAAAIVGVDGFQVSAFSWHPDPGELLTGVRKAVLPERNSENESKWQNFAKLVARGLETGGEARRRAAIRYMGVAYQNRLTEAETATIISALWAEEYTPADTLPGNTDLYDWAFLVIPEPELGIADARFRMKWLPADLGDMQFCIPDTGGMISISSGDERRVTGRVEDVLWNLGAALSGLREYGRAFELDDHERDRIVQLVERWIDHEVESHPNPMLQEEIHRSNLSAIDGLASILWEMEVPEAVCGRFFDKIKRLDELGTPAFELTGGLVQIMPDRTDELISWLRRGLASDDGDTVQSALAGLGSWLRRATKDDAALHQPTQDLIREIGLIITARRREALAHALDFATMVFDVGSEEFREVIQEYVLQGLDYLATELDYEREHNDAEEVPLLRLRCAHLALSMARSGLRSHDVVAKWLKIAANDPLPEVRQSVEREPVYE